MSHKALPDFAFRSLPADATDRVREDNAVHLGSGLGDLAPEGVLVEDFTVASSRFHRHPGD